MPRCVVGIRRVAHRMWRWYARYQSLSLLVAIGFAIMALLAPLLAPYGATQRFPDAILSPPSARHLLGTDQYGFDIGSRIVWASRVDLVIAFIGVTVSVVVGVFTGSLAGLSRHRRDIGSRLAEMFQAFPLILFALLLFAVLGNHDWVLVVVIVFVDAPMFFKLSRTLAQPLREAEFVLVAGGAGVGSVRVALRHVIPNIMAPIASQFAVTMAFAIQIVAGLSFLGFGVAFPDPEWGSMIQEGAGEILRGVWWPSVFPGCALILATVAFVGLGRNISKAFDIAHRLSESGVHTGDRVDA